MKTAVLFMSVYTGYDAGVFVATGSGLAFFATLYCAYVTLNLVGRVRWVR